jgi:uncharacterized protein YeaO (DUF488 family)
MIQLKRVYDKDMPGDVFKVLVDRLWPRGISKSDGIVDVWYKEISPSTELRKWYNHDPDKWESFKKKYREELTRQEDNLREILSLEKQHKKILLLYSSKEEKLNNAVVLQEVLSRMK